MGQRLVIQIETNGIPLTNAYYHWSGYTESALALLEKVVEAADWARLAQLRSNVYKAVKILENTGAGVNDEEAAEIQKDNRFNGMSFKPAISRDEGFLCVTGQGMLSNRDWMEALATVDIAERKIYFDVYVQTDIDDYEEWSGITAESLPHYDSSTFGTPFVIPFEKLGEFEALVECSPNGLYFSESNYGLSVIEWIA